MTEQGETGVKLPPVHQLGYVVSDIEKTCRYYESTFGMGPFSEVIDVDMDGALLRGKPVKTKIKVAFAQSGDVQVEFIQPFEGENVYTEFLESKGDGIHHLAFQVDDMDAMKAEFAKKGFEPVFQRDMEVMEFAYFDTSEFGGLMVEFLYYK
jgi:methylmalonyl-CoA/ethylmalonyl-CoA epimerase